MCHSYGKPEALQLVSIARRLPLLLAVLTVVAGGAGAQVNPNHMRQRRDQGAQGTSIEDAAKQLSSNDPDARLEAVKALGISKDSRATGYLIKAVGDSDVRVQAKAIQSLGDARANESTPTLVECLIMRTTDARMQQFILAALGKIGDGRAAQPLMEFLKRDLDVATRGTAIFALGEIGAPEATDVLEHIAQTDEDPVIRRVASEAVHKIVAHYGTIRGDDRGTVQGIPEHQGPTPTQQGQHPHR